MLYIDYIRKYYVIYINYIRIYILYTYILCYIYILRTGNCFSDKIIAILSISTPCYWLVNTIIYIGTGTYLHSTTVPRYNILYRHRVRKMTQLCKLTK